MSVAGELLNGVALWVTRRERAEERDNAAIRSVLTAVTVTQQYLAARQRGKPADREKEAELVALWTTASVHIRRTDPQLAVRLAEKAEYWTNPEHWSGDEVAANRIQIDKIAREARQLLDN